MVCWHVSSWSRTVFHFPDCNKFSSFYIVHSELGNYCCLPEQTGISANLTSPHLIQLFVLSLLGISIWEQKLNFIATERQGKSLFIKMKWRTCCMDNWSTALLKTWETVRYGGRSVFLISVLRSLASLWFKQKPETGIVGRALAWADLTQGPG